MEKNTKYGRIEDGRMIFAPALISNDDVQIINPTSQDYYDNDYKFISLEPATKENVAETIIETEVDITYFY